MYRRQFIAGLMLATSPLAITHTVAQPAPAPGTIPAPVFLNMAAKGGMLLEETARDAFAKTQNPRVKTFAKAEVVEQVNITDKLTAASGGMMAAAPGRMAPGGVVGGLVAAPFMVAGAAVGAAGTLVGLGGAPVPMSSDAQKADMIARTQAMGPGPQYDAMFVNTQLMGHQEAYAVYSNYAQSGDDPALRRIARGALPLLRLHISQLSRMQSMMGPGPQG